MNTDDPNAIAIRPTTRDLAGVDVNAVVTFECECVGDAVVDANDLSTYIVLTGQHDLDQCDTCGRLYRVVDDGVWTWLPDAV